MTPKTTARPRLRSPKFTGYAQLTLREMRAFFRPSNETMTKIAHSAIRLARSQHLRSDSPSVLPTHVINAGYEVFGLRAMRDFGQHLAKESSSGVIP